MATFRGSNHQVGASSVWTNGDLANLIDNLYRQSIRAGANGEYERGLRDMAQSIADATNSEIDLYPDGRYDHYNVDVHAERITERYQCIEERRERTIERYQAQTIEQEAPPTLAETDVVISDFVPGSGYMRRMDAGWMWVANSGAKTFFPVQQWVEISGNEARAMGYLVAENRPFILVLRSSMEAWRHQLTGGQRRQLR